MSAHRYPLDIIRTQQVAWRTPGVNPVAVADKLKAIRELRAPMLAEQLNTDPRLAYLLWFLQWLSHQPGGLDGFVKDTVLEFPGQFITAEMAKIPWPRSGFYSLEEAVRVYRSMNSEDRHWFDIGQDLSLSTGELEAKRRERREAALLRGLELAAKQKRHEDHDSSSENQPSDKGRKRNPSDPLDDPEIEYLLHADFSELRKIDPRKHPGATRLISLLTPDFFWSTCAMRAISDLPEKLSRLCTSFATGFTLSLRYFQDAIPTLLEMMDHHAVKARAAIAATTITDMVIDKLQFAISQRANVLLAGDARLGKTVTLETLCKMWPGRVRLVTVPTGTSEREFLEAHAAAFYWPYDLQTTIGELRAAVKHVLRDSGLFVAYDEFHFAIPHKPRKGINPPRLDFVRCNVVDRKLGVAFCTTRQAYSRALSEFVKHTRWAIEQWAGRLHDVTVFGSEVDDPTAIPPLTRDDVLAIARKKFPDVESDVLELVACKAYQSSTPAHAVESILLRARWAAKKSGRIVPTTADSEAAIREWESQPAHDAFENPSGPPSVPVKCLNPAATTRLPPRHSPPMQAQRNTAASRLPGSSKTPDLPPDHSTNRAESPLALGTA